MENKTLSVGRCAERTAATYCDLEGSGEPESRRSCKSVTPIGIARDNGRG